MAPGPPPGAVAVGSIDAHFRSKQKLFVALMDRRRGEETGAAEEYLAGGLASALDRLDEQVGRLADNRHGALLGAGAWLFAGTVQHRRLAPAAMADDLYSRALTALLDGPDRS